MKYLFWILNSLLLFAGCKSDRQEETLSPGLIRAEALMWDEPESALALLDTLTVPAGNDYQYATWCLLYTQAQNRNEITPASDSLIQVAVSYFEPRKDIHRKAMAWFYAGQVYADLRQVVEAAGFYVKARDAALQTSDHRLQYLICLSYGWLSLNQMALDQAKELFHEARLYAEESGIDKFRVTALDYTGRYYAFNQQMDSAALLLEQAVGLARQIGEPKLLRMTLNDASIAYQWIEKYDQAISYLQEGITIGHSINKTDLHTEYKNLGDIYRMREETDSASYYLNKVLETDNPRLLRSCYFSLADMNRLSHNWDKAVHYTDLFWQYTDSIALFAFHKNITELYEISEYKRIENKNDQLRIEKKQIVEGGVICFIVFLLLLVSLVYVYQRKLLRKEHLRLSIQSLLEEQLQVHQANEREINQNNEIIHSITARLARVPELEVQKREQEDILRIVHDHNERLRLDNQQLDLKISDHIQALQEKKINQALHDQITRQNESGQNRVELLQKKLLQRMNLTGQLKKEPEYLSQAQIRTIYEEVNMLYPMFNSRLSNQYTHLSDFDGLTCCLIKLRFTTSQIAILTGVEATSVTKRKRRIKENMQIDQPDLWKNNTSLDVYLWRY